MFDPYTQMSAHARNEAFLHPRKFTTWQDALRENPDTDFNPEWQRPSSGGLLHGLAASLRARLLRWRLNGLQQRAGEAAGRDVQVR
jgi:hypothetical protein